MPRRRASPKGGRVGIFEASAVSRSTCHCVRGGIILVKEEPGGISFEERAMQDWRGAKEEGKKRRNKGGRETCGLVKVQGSRRRVKWRRRMERQWQQAGVAVEQHAGRGRGRERARVRVSEGETGGVDGAKKRPLCSNGSD